MKNVLKVASILFFAVGLTVSGKAQTEALASPEERAQMQTAIMTEVLTLTEDQVLLVEDINLKYSEKVEEIRKEDTNRREKFKAVRQLMKEKDAELKKVFTETQYSVYQEKKAALREKIKERRKS